MPSHPMRVALLIGRSPLERYSLHRGYVDAVIAAGAVPVIVPSGPQVTSDVVMELASTCDALLATGGGDIDPSFYGRPPVQEGLMDPDPSRDQLELQAVMAALETGKPVLGICRGAQLVAVATKGTLVADLPAAGYVGHWDLEREHEPVHGIEVDPGTLAIRALGGATRVNSVHHQAIATCGPQLRPTAWSPDGVIEAVEGDGLLGLQWHPERLFAGDPRHLSPFSWLVSA